MHAARESSTGTEPLEHLCGVGGGGEARTIPLC
jgi:hypothetical protein